VDIFMISLRKMSFPFTDPFFITKNIRPISIKFSITSPHMKESLCFDVRHLRCVITNLNSNWERVINTTKFIIIASDGG
jgi:hypothetical protein